MAQRDLAVNVQGEAYCRDSIIFGNAGCHIVTCGFLGLFPENYWNIATDINSIYFCVYFKGDLKVKIIRKSNFYENCIFEGRFYKKSCEEISLKIDIINDDNSILYVDIFFEEKSEIHDLRWMTDDLPIRSPALDILYLVPCIDKSRLHPVRELALAVAEADPQIFNQIIVVDETAGSQEVLKELNRAGSLPSIRLMDSGDSDICAGLQRALTVAATGTASHVLVLSGELSFDAALFMRLYAILCYAAEDIIVSGIHLDLLYRSKIHCVGGIDDPDSQRLVQIRDPLGNDVQCEQSAESYRLADFNGRWCLALPVQAIIRNGLPLPLHIGAAAEYGQRLERDGYEIVHWPGLAVCGPPLPMSQPPWQAFYEARDMLFMGEWRGEAGRLANAWRLAGVLAERLLQYDYESARVMLRGLAAYNAGVTALLAWSYQDHARLVAEPLREYRPEGQRFPPLRTRRLYSKKNGATSSRGTLALLGDLFVPFGKFLIRYGFIREENLGPFLAPRPQTILIRRAAARRLETRRYNWFKTWRLILAFAWHSAVMLLVRRPQGKALRELTNLATFITSKSDLHEKSGDGSQGEYLNGRAG